MSSRAGAKRHILITAGPTREKIDPIRFISNYSTGIFGYEIAKEARRRGHSVALISGPTALEAPFGVRVVQVESAIDMRRAVAKEFSKFDCVVMAGAVSDWRAQAIAKRKIKRSSNRKMALKLVKNPDILKELGENKRGKILVGFALETEDLEKNAIKKLREKNLDLIIANRYKEESTIFGGKKIDALMIDRYGKKIKLLRKSKKELAEIILDKIEKFNI